MNKNMSKKCYEFMFHMRWLKVQCHEIFYLWFFSLNNPTWASDSRVKAFLHMASNSRKYSTKHMTPLEPGT
jgi:hypothetical protein